MYFFVKKRLILLLVFILLALFIPIAGAVSGTVYLLNPSGGVVTQKTCNGDVFSCSVSYSDCDQIGQYTVRFSADGESISKNAYYCSPDDNQGLCESLGFTWTGSKCCGDWDVANKYYNDGNRGCWNSSAVLSGNFSTDEHDVVNYNGQFYGCNITAKNYIEDNEYLLDLMDHHTNDVLIQNKDYCEVLAGGYYYCSYTERWLPGLEAQMHLSFVPWETTGQETECCGIDSCFNGEGCVENQADDSSPDYGGFRCIDSNWVEAMIAFTPDRNTSGYCPRTEQCLVNLQGNSEDNDNPEGNPICIDDGQYIRDDYCENRTWTSRTKLIALQLLDLPGAEDDYVLFCGDYGEVLNHLDYDVGGDKIARDYVVDKTNNYCVLVYDDKLVFGASLNQEINVDDGKYPFMDVIDVDCGSAMADDGQYHQCPTEQAWYNKKLKSIIYSQDTIDLSEINLADKSLELLDGPFLELTDKLEEEITEPYYLSFGFRKFKNLYANKKDNKFILGTMEGTQYRNIIIEYLNLDTDICEVVDVYSQYHGDSKSGILCSKEGKDYYILAQGGMLTTLNPANIWGDLTAKLRIS